MNIQPADVPGFGVASSEQQRSAGEQRLERAMLGCVGVLTGHSELAEVNSKEFEHTDRTGDFGVSSSVSVARTPAVAAKGLAATHNPNAQSCVIHQLSREVEGKPNGGSSIRSLSVVPERALAPGTDGGVVLRIVANVSLGGKPAPIALDFYGFVCGQAQIGLFTTSLPGSFPSKPRQQLLSLLLARAKAHGQCTGSHHAGASAAFEQ
ncbi:MAG TPA: hypothetical protein VG053_06070 [Solirubrobacteraceae bacterium]|nr:hypothetical protein [Solirubrobacteraceae bacterium]